MNYEANFTNAIYRLASEDPEMCAQIAVEAFDDAAKHERYEDAALITMLACRRIPGETQPRLINSLAAHNSWPTVCRLRYFVAWLETARRQPTAAPRLKYDDSESGWVERSAFSDDDLLSACRDVFSGLTAQLETYGDRKLGGMNLLFFLNRSRKRHDHESRVYNPAAFGMHYIDPTSDDEHDSLLGQVERGEIRIKSVLLGTPEPDSREEKHHVLD